MKSEFIYSIKVTTYLIKKELFTVKSAITLLLLAIFMFTLVEPIRNFVISIGIKTTPMISIFVFSDFTCQMLILIAFIFIISNAPFIDRFFPYVVSRTGARSFYIGTVLYLMLTAFFYVIFIVLLANLYLIGEETLVFSWGKIWGTIARTDAGELYGIQIGISDQIIGNYDAVRALVLSIFLEWLGLVWLSICACSFNATFKNKSGIIIASLFVFLDTMIYNSWSYYAYLLSPVSLINIESYTGMYNAYGITPIYAAAFFTVTLILFAIIFVKGSRLEKYNNRN